MKEEWQRHLYLSVFHFFGGLLEKHFDSSKKQQQLSKDNNILRTLLAIFQIGGIGKRKEGRGQYHPTGNSNRNTRQRIIENVISGGENLF